MFTNINFAREPQFKMFEGQYLGQQKHKRRRGIQYQERKMEEEQVGFLRSRSDKQQSQDHFMGRNSEQTKRVCYRLARLHHKELKIYGLYDILKVCREADHESLH